MHSSEITRANLALPCGDPEIQTTPQTARFYKKPIHELDDDGPCDSARAGSEDDINGLGAVAIISALNKITRRNAQKTIS